MRAAASSIARGRPSSRWHISATAGAFSLVIWKSGLAFVARSMKRRTASYWVSCSRACYELADKMGYGSESTQSIPERCER
jgi:hypothetical protein